MICADARGMLTGLNQIKISNRFFFFFFFCIKQKGFLCICSENKPKPVRRFTSPFKTFLPVINRLLLRVFNGGLSAQRIVGDLPDVASESPGRRAPPADPAVSLAVFQRTSCSCSGSLRGGPEPPVAPGGSGPEFTARPVHLYFSCVFLVNTNAYLERVDSSRPFCWTDAAFCPTTLAFKSTPELTRVHLCPHCVDPPPPSHLQKKMPKVSEWNFFAECPRFFLFHRFNVGLFLFSKEAEHSLAVFHNSSTRRSLAKEFFWKCEIQRVMRRC